MKPMSYNGNKRLLFGTSGIRGSVEELFTNQFCFDMGRTFEMFLQNHKQKGVVAIGMDPRESSPRVKEGLIAGLGYEGRETKDGGATPIPAVNYVLISHPEVVGGVMVSGSHIKVELNGLKFFAFGEEILKEHEAEIARIYEKIKDKVSFVKGGVEVTETDEMNLEYGEFLMNLADKWPKWKVVIDPGNGAMTPVMPELLSRLGLELVELNCDIQGGLLARDTESEGEMEQLQDKVKEVGADFGVGFDTDGDRVIFVDERGEYVSGEYSGSLIAKYYPTDVVVCPINVSTVVEKIGKPVVRTKVGSPYVVAGMKKQGASFGFEANGGGIFSTMYSRDGGHSLVQFLNILAASGKRMSKLVAELPKYYLYKTKVDYKWELQDKILEEAKREFKGEKVEELDGLKIWLDAEKWILFRSSQNAPEFRVWTEAKSQKEAEDLASRGMDLVKRIIGDSL